MTDPKPITLHCPPPHSHHLLYTALPFTPLTLHCPPPHTTHYTLLSLSPHAHSTLPSSSHWHHSLYTALLLTLTPLTLHCPPTHSTVLSPSHHSLYTALPPLTLTLHCSPSPHTHSTLLSLPSQSLYTAVSLPSRSHHSLYTALPLLALTPLALTFSLHSTQKGGRVTLSLTLVNRNWDQKTAWAKKVAMCCEKHWGKGGGGRGSSGH